MLIVQYRNNYISVKGRTIKSVNGKSNFKYRVIEIMKE